MDMLRLRSGARVERSEERKTPVFKRKRGRKASLPLPVKAPETFQTHHNSGIKTEETEEVLPVLKLEDIKVEPFMFDEVDDELSTSPPPTSVIVKDEDSQESNVSFFSACTSTPLKPTTTKIETTLPRPDVFDEDSRGSNVSFMSTSDSISTPLTPTTIEKETTETTLFTPVDEDSRGTNVSITSTATPTTKTKRFSKGKDPSIDQRIPVTAETLLEYQWPQNDEYADFFFIQEQISDYLGVKSFKRKYPNIRRHRVEDIEERDFIRSSTSLSRTQCDLGLTALDSCDVLDMMSNEFPRKYEEYLLVCQERSKQEVISKLEARNKAVLDCDKSDLLKSCANWNVKNNRKRKEERSCFFDLQTGTFHYPMNKMKVLPPEATKLGHYPVATLPGYYTDYYKEYTPQELCYLPLNTVRYGPVPEDENWTVEPDSESESTTGATETTAVPADSKVSPGPSPSSYEIVTVTDDFGNILYRGPPGMTKVSGSGEKCKTCDGDVNKNKKGGPEVLLHCSQCDVTNHPTCLDLTMDMLPYVTKYEWVCTDCKFCLECNDPGNEDKMIFCDCCDRGYHTYCLRLLKAPTSRWHCKVCSVCYSCGATQPSSDDKTAEWHHQFQREEKNVKFFLYSFCVSCYKLYRKGQLCPSCNKTLANFDKDDLLECNQCEKFVHKACAKRPTKSVLGFMCDPCDTNFRSWNKLPSHLT